MKRYGIQWKLGGIILAVIVIYFSSISVLFFQLTRFMQERAYESYQSLLRMYVRQLELEIGELDKYINTLSIDFDINMLALENPSTDTYQLRLYQIRHNIFSYYHNYRILTGFYLFDSRRNSITYIPDDRGHYAEFVHNAVDGKWTDGWYRFDFEQKSNTALARTYRFSETQWLFAFVSLTNIADEFEDIAKENNLFWDIEDAAGNVLYGTSEIRKNITLRNSYDMISQQLAYNSVELTFNLFVGKDVMWERNRTYMIYFATSLLIFSLLVVIVIWYTEKMILKPLRILLNGMERFSSGDDYVQIDEQPKAEPEILHAFQSFNCMVEQIRNNKFFIYETKLEQQKLLIQNMQSQINPHFFSNTTNLIYNLLEIGKMDIAEQCLLLLSSYYRYMTSIGQDFTTLKKEMGFVDSYLEIMNLRFPNKLFYETEIDECLHEMMIPPLLIQPLAENCIKHGFTDRKHKFYISIRVYTQGTDAIIDVVDTGKGFPEKYRGRYDEQTPMLEKESGCECNEHVGMRNIYRRLIMQYHDRASMVVDWTGKSTLVQIRISNWENKQIY